MTTSYRKKLIEVAIPLEAINKASAREKSIRHGHPSTLHLWWARRPLAACRAVLFAQLVDDPSSHPEQFPTDEAVEAERQRLFKIIEDLILWESSTNAEVLERARAEIRRSCGGVMPAVYDPFSGGGSIPLEAQRLGLPAYGSDLNPVAVMIGKAMIEVPPKFKDMPPVHPGVKGSQFYRNAEGLAEDVKFYGEWMRSRAVERLGHLYPDVDLPKEYGGGKATVTAWIWARTVPSPDPAFSDAQVPLVSSFTLSNMGDREAWISPIVDKKEKRITYRMNHGGEKDDIRKASEGTKSGRGANFLCLYSNTAITPDYIKQKGRSGEMGQALIAIVAEGPKGRVYVAPSPVHEQIALNAVSDWKPAAQLANDPRNFWTVDYGLATFGDLFTGRQLIFLKSMCDILQDVHNEIKTDVDQYNSGAKNASGLSAIDASEYADAVAIYLAFLVSKLADKGSSLCTWDAGPASNRTATGRSARVATVRVTFGRQSLPMTWDFAEVNFLGAAVGSLSTVLNTLCVPLLYLPPDTLPGFVTQADAQTQTIGRGKVVSTDPPYYDNIAYADLSDFFYVWLSQALAPILPDLFSTLATPKADELVASPYRRGGREAAERFFLDGMKQAISNLAQHSNHDFPATIYYAFKQSEVKDEGISSTGWATFLEAVIGAGYAVVGTWPIRTEMSSRMIASGTNALANSVVLVCRKREEAADVISRAEFIRALKRELPPAIAELQAANIAPADMPQSAIGPGMGVFSRYKAVLESDDSPMSVKSALRLINRELDEYLGGIQGEFDADTRFAITWFEQNGAKAGDYGVANSIAQARGISVESVKHARIVESAAGKVRILGREELDPAWDPTGDRHLTVWECCQQLIRALENDGEHSAAVLIKKIGVEKADAVKDLAYCLYGICEKRSDAKEATSYNALIAVWTELTRQAATIYDTGGDRQAVLNI